jgi:hypothetical protein
MHQLRFKKTVAEPPRSYVTAQKDMTLANLECILKFHYIHNFFHFPSRKHTLHCGVQIWVEIWKKLNIIASVRQHNDKYYVSLAKKLPPRKHKD